MLFICRITVMTTRISNRREILNVAHNLVCLIFRQNVFVHCSFSPKIENPKLKKQQHTNGIQISRSLAILMLLLFAYRKIHRSLPGVCLYIPPETDP